MSRCAPIRSESATVRCSPCEARERVDRPLLSAVMQWADGNQSKASELLGIHRNTLRAKLKSLGVDKK